MGVGGVDGRPGAGAGAEIVHLLLGGPVIGGDTLSRFFALHVFVIPGLLLAFLAVHLWLVLKRGISAPPVPGQAVDPETYDEEYEKELKKGVPFLGDAMLKDAFFSALTVIVVVVLAAVARAEGAERPARPGAARRQPQARLAVLWLFALLSLSPPAAETFIILVFPVILIVALLLVPFVSNRGERAPSRRPVAVLSVIVIFAVLGVLTYQGATAPWSPVWRPGAATPFPRTWSEPARRLQLQGAVVFQNKQCRNCHALDGVGGRRGPDLSGVGIRLTRDQLIDQISNGTPGGGNMPAYGKQMKPAEMTALVEFLVSLRPDGSAAGPAGRDQPTVRSEAAMNPTLDAFLRSWPFEPWLLASLLLTAGVYLRGWLALHRRDPARWPCGQPVAFLGGLAALFLALASPIEPFAVVAAASPHGAAPAAHDGRAAACSGWVRRCSPCSGGCRGRSARTGSAPLLSAAVACVERSRSLTHPLPAWLLFVGGHLVLARPAGLRARPCARTAGTICSTSVSSARRCCSGIRSSGRIPAGRAGRPGCLSRT